MNTSQLKAYAPQARRDFIAAVTARAAKYGLTAKAVAPMTEQGDVVLIGDKAFPRAVAAQRRKLEERIDRQGFAQVIEAMAYIWFNRCMAIRYMELHGYLDHGRRVLSHPAKAGAFEILVACTQIELPGVNRERVIELKLDGNKDEELYRLLLLGQCHALHQAMPFLFEAIDDETELLLPDNLTRSDSPIRHLVDDIPEDNWQEIEIIGWLYQFYISEKKDQVIGKVVQSEDIPAATQLFTPNWIVKYMVQNSLGAHWLATYPDSKLKGQMEYYIEPAEQTDEVNAQLAAITPSQLNPEELTLIDPASGSGHILVEAYELFKAIYLERGYRQRDVPQLILEKNLFGLDIDERAAQLTGFALMMKGRADDRRLFERGVKLNVMALQDSTGFDAEGLAKGVALRDYGLEAGDLTELKRLFEHATTFGSLIQVPKGLTKKLPALRHLSKATSQDLFVSEALKRLGPLVLQAELLAAQYDAVVANPPYMGSRYYCAALRDFVGAAHTAGKADLYSAFALRNLDLVKAFGRVGMITIPNWMFLPSFADLRAAIFNTSPIASLVHNGRGVWGSDFGSCAFVLRRAAPQWLAGRFLRLFEKQGSVANSADLQRRFHAYPRFTVQNSAFNKIPGSPVAYWVNDNVRRVFTEAISLNEVAELRVGMATSDNDRFLRHWHEVSIGHLNFAAISRADAIDSGKKWFPYSKGGVYRKWFGNNYLVVNWSNDGREIVELATKLWGSPSKRIYNTKYFYREAITWSLTSNSAGGFCARWRDKGFIFDVNGMSSFVDDETSAAGVLCAVNSCVGAYLLGIINPTMAFQAGDLARFPYLKIRAEGSLVSVADTLIRLARSDWNARETAWDFQSLPILTASSERNSKLEFSFTTWITQNRDTIAEMKRLEEENNRLFIDAYGLADELTPDVPLSQITLTVNPAYRYGGKLTEEEQWTRFRQDTMEELVSYAIGCVMGRYSLDAPGLIYAHSGNEGFDPSRYPSFPADDDGIVPITDTDWFDDDAAHRLIEFISVAWDKGHLEDNLTFLADDLGRKKTESSREAIRRYLCDKFFSDHLQVYKKRPIYWLFSSGKQRAFQCLVYLHRYNQGTLARMRTQYAIPLQGLVAGRIEQLAEDIAAAGSTAHRKRLEKERDKLIKQRTELQQFDEKLRHYADQRIELDLDDGVKVNYGKFGDLLAEVKDVTWTEAD